MKPHNEHRVHRVDGSYTPTIEAERLIRLDSVQKSQFMLLNLLVITSI